jgi:hypothetical protein
MLFDGGALADTFCVRSGAAGTGSGADWTNAFDDLPNALLRGSEYLVADGTYDGYDFNDAPSGATTITIRKATPDNHGTDTGWQDSHGDGQAVFGSIVFSRPYYVIDGATGGGPGSWDTGHGIKIKGAGGGEKLVSFGGSGHHCTIQHVELEHRGLNTGTPDDGVYALGAGNNFTMRRCYLHTFGRAPILTRGESDWLIEYCFITRNSSDPVQHSEAWSDQNTANVVFRHNLLTEIEGTAYIAFLDHGGGLQNNWEIYGNVFADSGPDGIGDGVVIAVAETAVTNFKIYNNVIANIDNSWTAGFVFPGGAGNVQIHNNVWWKLGSKPNGGNIPIPLDGTVSHNAYFRCIANVEPGRVTGNEDPFLDPAGLDYRIPPTSAAFNAGLALDAGFDPVDAYGATRGARGGWDMGAYEFPPDMTAPSPPDNLAVGARNENSIVLVWSPAVDNLFVDHYLVYRNGQLLGQTPETSHPDDNLSPSTGYIYHVVAVDGDGNRSIPSTPLRLSTIPASARVWNLYD